MVYPPYLPELLAMSSRELVHRVQRAFLAMEFGPQYVIDPDTRAIARYHRGIPIYTLEPGHIDYGGHWLV